MADMVAARVARRVAQRRRVAAHGLPAGVPHSAYAFRLFGCRCQLCTAAYARVQERRLVRLDRGLRHGR